MSKLSYIGNIKDGKLIFTGPTRTKMLAEIKAYEGRRVEVVVSKLPKRSSAQNAYYFGVVVDMVRDALKGLGHTVDATDTHNFLKDKFNGKDIANADGELIGRIGESTTKMNKVDFMGYLAAIQIWAATYLNIVIPDPESQTTLQFNELPPITIDPTQFAKSVKAA